VCAQSDRLCEMNVSRLLISPPPPVPCARSTAHNRYEVTHSGAAVSRESSMKLFLLHDLQLADRAREKIPRTFCLLKVTIF
jgi:hypothetical protein